MAISRPQNLNASSPTPRPNAPTPSDKTNRQTAQGHTGGGASAAANRRAALLAQQLGRNEHHAAREAQGGKNIGLFHAAPQGLRRRSRRNGQDVHGAPLGHQHFVVSQETSRRKRAAVE